MSPLRLTARTSSGAQRWLPLVVLLLGCPGKTPEDSNPPDDSTPAPVDEDEDGYDSVESGGDDCDDTDANSNPGADDVPYDGTDQDCDGADLTDVDGDGHDGEPAGGDDCNDSNPEIYAGVPEVCYDGLDNDCDGNGGPDDTAAMNDCDGDGAVRIDDCNDEDATVYPGATDAWYDGIDSDCGADSDYDQDLDGEDAISGGGLDCDDLSATVNTEADELWDGVDNDCEGTLDQLRSGDNTASWYGEYASDDSWLGHDFALVQDLDTDGVRDIAIGSPLTGSLSDFAGVVYIMSVGGGSAAPSTAALATIRGSTNDYLGLSLVTLPDGNLLATGLYAAYLFTPDQLVADVSVSAAAASFSPIQTFGYVGAWEDGIAAIGDAYTGSSGTVQVWSGEQVALGGSHASGTALWSITETGSGKGAGFPGDLDGDGVEELCYGVTGLSDNAKIGLVPGEIIAVGGVGTSDDVVTITGATASDSSTQVTVQAAGGDDYDGDGYRELVVSAMEAEGAAPGSGVVYVLDGDDALLGGALTDLASATVLGQVEDGQMAPAWTSGDLDSDGVDDLVLTFAGIGSGDVESEIWFVTAAVVAAGGSITPATGAPAFAANSPDDQFGFSTRVLDADDDGDDDLFVSALNSYGSVSWFRQE